MMVFNPLNRLVKIDILCIMHLAGKVLAVTTSINLIVAITRVP